MNQNPVLATHGINPLTLKRTEFNNADYKRFVELAQGIIGADQSPYVVLVTAFDNDIGHNLLVLALESLDTSIIVIGTQRQINTDDVNGYKFMADLIRTTDFDFDAIKALETFKFADVTFSGLDINENLINLLSSEKFTAEPSDINIPNFINPLTEIEQAYVMLMLSNAYNTLMMITGSNIEVVNTIFARAYLGEDLGYLAEKFIQA